MQITALISIEMCVSSSHRKQCFVMSSNFCDRGNTFKYILIWIYLGFFVSFSLTCVCNGIYFVVTNFNLHVPRSTWNKWQYDIKSYLHVCERIVLSVILPLEWCYSQIAFILSTLYCRGWGGRGSWGVGGWGWGWGSFKYVRLCVGAGLIKSKVPPISALCLVTPHMGVA